jgi:hypothetical protein
LFGTAIWQDTTENVASKIIKYAPAILSAPGQKFQKLREKLFQMDLDPTQYRPDLQALLLDKTLTVEEKLEILRIKVEYALKHLSGKRKFQFLATLLTLILFFMGSGTPGFAAFAGYLRELLGSTDNKNTIGEYLIDIYREYNAPLPQELDKLIRKIPK